ncbi:MAG: hypothetical protein K0Q72_4553 [Armatimonadetes bacterium]|jgi:hypothetical protein|nr:hypothetical protein [Armatimonadota bacterium]
MYRKASHLLLSVALLPTAGPALASCAMARLVVTYSANRRHQFVPGKDFHFAFKSSGAPGGYRTVAKGAFKPLGHHHSILVPNSGERLVLVDGYAGVAVLHTDGKLLRALRPEELLTPAEQRERPGKWPCHPEGHWLKGAPKLTQSDQALDVTLYSGRKIRVSLRDGSVNRTEARGSALQSLRASSR